MKYRLTDTAVKKLKLLPPDSLKKFEKYTDGGGLYLYVTKHGKYWRYDYRNPKRDTMTFGEYPTITLEQARELHRAARALSAQGINPKDDKKQKAQQAKADTITFKEVSLAWFEMKKKEWSSDKHATTIMSRFELHVYSFIGDRPIASIEPTDVLTLLERLANQDKLESAKRVRSIISQVFRYAITKRYVKFNAAADLVGAIPSPKERHFSAIIEPKEAGVLLNNINNYQGNYLTKAILKLSAYLFGRPTEMRTMEWAEIDFERKQWEIAAEKMKGRRPHIVPLSTQAITLLEQLKSITGHGRYVFPSVTDRQKPMSNNTVRSSLRRMGYANEDMTAHGFRSMASTLLYERGYDEDVIERSLAHNVGSAVRRAYDRSQRLADRAGMMQDWADYLDALAAY